MGFEDLDDAAGEQASEKDNETVDAGVSDAPDTSSTGASAVQDSDPEPEPEPDDDPLETPAFPYEQGSMQTTIYVRKDVREDWEDAKDFEVAAILKREHGVRKVAGREYDDALFRLGADHPELVAKYVMEARGIDVENLSEDS